MGEWGKAVAGVAQNAAFAAEGRVLCDEGCGTRVARLMSESKNVATSKKATLNNASPDRSIRSTGNESG
jgi:hypothetical protein